VLLLLQHLVLAVTLLFLFQVLFAKQVWVFIF
jgi:hypothetical protein